MRCLPLIAVAISILTNCTSDVDYHKHALVYGISEYHINWMNLPYSASDADSIAKVLQTYGYDVLARTNSDVTKKQITNDLKRMKNRVAKNDLFLLYFSGHGINHTTLTSFNIDNDNSDFYAILAFDDRPMDSVYDRIQRNLLSETELHSLLREFKTKKIVTIIDACYSGGFIPQTTVVDMLPDTYTGTNDTLPSFFRIFREAAKQYKNSIRTGKENTHVGIVITASGRSEVAWDGFFGQSVFSYFLHKAPLYADYNSDGLITSLETYRFIYSSIERYWNSEEKDKEWNFLPRISTQPYDFVLFDLNRKKQNTSVVSF